ncbi:MAG: flagellar motor switch protein FliN [Actinomycetota bacterium]|nr:flagellar motor switch protein FliN [Actinomycetota bacterium]
MSIVTELTSNNEVAMTIAAAIERALGGDLILAVGLPRAEPPSTEVMPPGSARAVSVAFTQGIGGAVTLVVDEAMGRALEGSATDESLVTALGPAVTEGAAKVAAIAEDDVRTAGKAVEIAVGDLTDDASGDDEFVIYPLLDGNERVAAIVIRIAPLVDIAPANVVVHEFPTLHETEINLGDIRPLSLLHDVEMGVTAELGRRRMTVRDLLSLTPGAVIELDRAAGSPVDVLVNGTLIARGEVVVIDEEFGIRISEIVAPDAAGAR